jgi:hypothetical protein
MKRVTPGWPVIQAVLKHRRFEGSQEEASRIIVDRQRVHDLLAQFDTLRSA